MRKGLRRFRGFASKNPAAFERVDEAFIISSRKSCCFTLRLGVSAANAPDHHPVQPGQVRKHPDFLQPGAFKELRHRWPLGFPNLHRGHAPRPH